MAARGAGCASRYSEAGARRAKRCRSRNDAAAINPEEPVMNKETIAIENGLRALRDDEVEATSGAIIPFIIAAELFAIGFMGGVVACNVANDRPWYEF
jgi:hypothetical protein